MAHYVMYGFDTAGSLAEETAARAAEPRAILQALAACAAAGALLMLFTLMAAPDFAKLADPAGGLPAVVKEVLGDTVGTVFLIDIVFAISVCTLAVHTCAVRLMFAMARDNNLPFGRCCSRVSSTSRTPIVPALVAGVLAAAILVVNVAVPGFIGQVAPLAVLWANLAYLLVIVPLLVRRCARLADQRFTTAERVFFSGPLGPADQPDRGRLECPGNPQHRLAAISDARDAVVPGFCSAAGHRRAICCRGGLLWIGAAAPQRSSVGTPGRSRGNDLERVRCKKS